MKRAIATAAGLSLLCTAAVTSAAELRIGVAAEITSLDPHYHNYTPNNAMAGHVFDPLIRQDERQRLQPALATAWRALDDTTWEVELRRGVTFHGGAPFTAEDVAATLRRVPAVPNNPSSFVQFTGAIHAVEVVDPHRLRLRTTRPHPLLPQDLSQVSILPRTAEGAATDAFNAARATDGTGPFRMVRWQRGDRIEMTRNDGYWGAKPAWERVTFRLMTSDPSRVAALLSRDVDAIDGVPTGDIARLRANPAVAISSTGSNRVMILQLDSGREVTPFVSGKDGRPLPANPLRDARVRQAISLAFNRTAIAERAMDGQAIPTGQMVPEGFFGHDPTIPVPVFDPDRARALLAEAGYPDGFSLTLHAPNNRYVNDDRVAQALGGMLMRIGIAARVETMPSTVFFPRWGRLEHSVQLVGWGSSTGEAAGSLRAHVASFDRSRGFGTSNVGRYSNPEVDALLTRALATIDDRSREDLLRQVTRIAMRDVAFVPLHFQVNVWATRRGISYAARSDETTVAWGFTPAQ